MYSKGTFITTILTASFFISACGGAVSNQNSATNSTRADQGAQNTNSPLPASTPAPEQTRNNAPTLTPVYKAYCLAMEKQDEAAIRKVYSADTIKFLEGEAKADGVSLMKYLSTDRVTTELCEVRNEEITGDTAIAEIRTAGMPNGIKIIFVKEGGEWKLTTRSPNVDAVRQAAANSNSVR